MPLYGWALAIAFAGCGSPLSSSGASPTQQVDASADGSRTGALAEAGIADAGIADATAEHADSPVSDASSDASKEASIDAGPPPPPAAFITTDDLSQGLSPATLTIGAAGGAPGAVVTVDPTTTYQTIVGFGASITDSSSYVMTKYLSAADLQKALASLFDPDQGRGVGFLRQPMGASDFSSVGDYLLRRGASDPR